MSNLRPVFLPSSDDPGSWNPAAVEPSICPGEGHDLAEPETLEAEAAHFDLAHACIEGADDLCEGADILFDIGNPGSEETHGVEIGKSPHEWPQHISELFGLCIAWATAHFVETGPEPFDASSTPVMKAGGKQQHWVADTRTRQNQRSS